MGARVNRKQLTVCWATSALLLRPDSSIVLQRRGFRTRKSTGVYKGPHEDNPLRKFLLNDVFAKGKETKDASGGKWKLYEGELKKLPEADHKAFTDGFLKGVLIGKSDSPRRAFLIRLYVVCAGVALLFYLLSGDRQGSIGSLFFSTNQEVRLEDVQVTFEDVRGMDEAKEEVKELVAYLRDPDRFSRLGGRLPKGVLLVGPPGTGKTLLARAVAGEAKVPFFHTSGSEFDEVLVGQGARRVRDLFDRAKARAPCIIFIDEIDSVGAKRVSNGIHPYANQTINQLLSEMDGFHRNEGIIIIAATNREEDLDKALLRPGRFDIRVMVHTPDLAGRLDIIKHYLKQITHSTDINAAVIARGTTGFTGADIESMVNSAALKAARDDAVTVEMSHMEEARDRVLMGPARTAGRIPDELSNRNTAFHEAGHTLVALFTKHAMPIHKVTIIPRGQSMGHTALLPDKDEYQLTKQQLLAQLDVMMGGRVAEELCFGEDAVTTGAADDLSKATRLATQMVKQLGMSEKVGLRDFTVNDSSGAPIKISDISPQSAETIDLEITRLLNESYKRAKEILVKHKKEHNLLAEALLEYETLSADEIRAVCSGRSIRRAQPALTPPPSPSPLVDLRGVTRDALLGSSETRAS